jgi:hypothetical protein
MDLRRATPEQTAQILALAFAAVAAAGMTRAEFDAQVASAAEARLVYAPRSMRTAGRMPAFVALEVVRGALTTRRVTTSDATFNEGGFLSCDSVYYDKSRGNEAADAIIAAVSL